MERILEPEVMDGEEQVRVYANADFAEENQGFVDQFLALYPEVREEIVLDLGCGPADIPIRLLRSRPTLRVTGVDASGPMIHWAEEAVRQAGFADRIQLICGRFQDLQLDQPADAVISNSPGASCAQRVSVLVCGENPCQAGGSGAHHGLVATRHTGGGSGPGRSIRG